MALITSRKYSDNLRYFRRYLQGRGVNLRMTVVDPSPYPYASGDRIAVPGLHSDDRIVSVIDVTDMTDVTGRLDDGDKQAVLTVFSANKGIKFTAIKAGTEGNKINVVAAAAAGDSLPLSVVIGSRDQVLGTTGHPGQTVIQVNLATDGAGAVSAVGDNKASLVMAAILDAQEAMIGDAIVDLALTGSGVTEWTAQSIVPLANGSDFDMGPVAASLVTDLDYTSPYFDQEVRFVARKRGADGNDITVAYSAGGTFGVAVSGKAITVTYVVGVTTAKNVIDGVNADADASALVIASPAPGASDSSGLVATMAATNLDGGLDPGIKLTVADPTGKLLVTWVTRDEIDEN
jgi:hypothetical protein